MMYDKDIFTLYVQEFRVEGVQLDKSVLCM